MGNGKNTQKSRNRKPHLHIIQISSYWIIWLWIIQVTLKIIGENMPEQQERPSNDRTKPLLVTPVKKKNQARN